MIYEIKGGQRLIIAVANLIIICLIYLLEMKLRFQRERERERERERKVYLGEGCEGGGIFGF